MGELQWLDGYTGQSTDGLLALHGRYRTDSLIAAFEQGVQQKAARVGADRLSAKERTILAVEALEREMNNGGLGQFFVNESEYAPITTETLTCVGRAEAAALTREAIATLGVSEPVTAEAVQKRIAEDDDARDEKLNEYDTRYYEFIDDLAGALFEFIRINKSRIRLPE